jgi:recombination protein RecA
MADTKQRNDAVDLALNQIEKRWGKGAIMRLGDSAARAGIEAISCGSLGVDIATGIGGVPRARIVEIFGPESSGKTTFALHVVANVQKGGGIAAFIDAEHALDPAYAKLLGVDTDALLVSQPDDGEQALEIAEVLVRSGAVEALVIDSVAALVPRAEIEGEMGDSHVGLQARLMSQAMRKLAGVAKRTNCCLMFINQIREKIGVMFGNPETTPGGHALKFYSSMRIDIRRIGALKDGEKVIGNRTRVKIVKNKCAPPFRKAEFDILYGEGISRESDIIDLGLEHGLVAKAGSWLSVGDTRIGQGKENARKFLRDNPEMALQLETAIRVAAGLVPADGAPAAPATASEDAAASAATGRPPLPERPGLPEGPGRPERPERPEPPGRPERPERPDGKDDDAAAPGTAATAATRNRRGRSTAREAASA